MSMFFRRSKKVRGDTAESRKNETRNACATEISRDRDGEGDENRSIEVAKKKIWALPLSSSSQSAIEDTGSKQQHQPCESGPTSVGERVSNFVNGFRNIMAKGKNRRGNGHHGKGNKTRDQQQSNQQNQLTQQPQPQQVQMKKQTQQHPHAVISRSPLQSPPHSHSHSDSTFERFAPIANEPMVANNSQMAATNILIISDTHNGNNTKEMHDMKEQAPQKRARSKVSNHEQWKGEQPVENSSVVEDHHLYGGSPSLSIPNVNTSDFGENDKHHNRFCDNTDRKDFIQSKQFENNSIDSDGTNNLEQGCRSGSSEIDYIAGDVNETDTDNCILPKDIPLSGSVVALLSVHLAETEASDQFRLPLSIDDHYSLAAELEIGNMGQQSGKEYTNSQNNTQNAGTVPLPVDLNVNEDIFYELPNDEYTDVFLSPSSSNTDEFLLVPNSEHFLPDNSTANNNVQKSFPLLSSVGAVSANVAAGYSCADALPNLCDSLDLSENDRSSSCATNDQKPSVHAIASGNSSFNLSDIEEEEDDDDSSDSQIDDAELNVNGVIADISSIFEKLKRQERKQGTFKRQKNCTATANNQPSAFNSHSTEANATVEPNNKPINNHNPTLNHSHSSSASASVKDNLNCRSNNINNNCSKYFNGNDEQNVILFNNINDKTIGNTNENNLVPSIETPGGPAFTINSACSDNKASVENIQLNQTTLHGSDIDTNNFNIVQSDCGQGLASSKDIYSDDAMSLPDIVESIGNGINNGSSHGSYNTGNTLSSSLVRGEPCGAADDENNRCNENYNGVTHTSEELPRHEAKLVSQIKEAETNALNCQTKVNDLSFQINELERNLAVKTWNIDRLQAEIQAAYKEGDCVRQKLRLQEESLVALRAQMSDAENAHNIRYNDLEARYTELQEKFGQMQKLAIGLQVQLAEAQCDAADMRAVRDRLVQEFDEEKQALQDALDEAIIDRAEIEVRWQRDFEQLRTVNSDREEHLMQDCEWKIRKTEKACKDKIVQAEKAKKEALERVQMIEGEKKNQLEQVQHLRSNEAEVGQLRGLTNEQRESINSLTMQIDELKEKLREETNKLTDTMKKIEKITFRYTQELGDKDRQMAAKIEEARSTVACMWEDRLMNEMLRLKVELESCYAEDRADSLRHAHEEYCEEIAALKESFSFKEKVLKDEIEQIKNKLADRNRRLEVANEKADKQIMQIRLILDKAERDHQREIDAEISLREEQLKTMQADMDSREETLRDEFNMRLKESQERFSTEVKQSKVEITLKIRKQYEDQLEKSRRDREEMVQDLERNNKRKLFDADTRMEDMEILHQRELKDLQNAHVMERCALEQRDHQNSQEIETLHRKCRCLTKLFEEMRMRYERRDPRPEDVRQIEELKTLIEAQDKDLRRLTETLREIQITQQLEEQNQPYKPQRKSKKTKLNCEVIYEENEERESPTFMREAEEIK